MIIKIMKILEKAKKSIFTLEDKEKLEILFNNKKKSNEKNVKKIIINIRENLFKEENNDNNNDNEKDNIRIDKSKTCKVIGDYAIFLTMENSIIFP